MLGCLRARAIVLSAVVLGLVALGACGGTAYSTAADSGAVDEAVEVPALQPATETAQPCDGGFAYGLVADIGGDPTAEAALQTWLDGTRTDLVVAPPSAPRAGWAASAPSGEDTQSFAAGTWTVGVWRSTKGEWVVNSQGCRADVAPVD